MGHNFKFRYGNLWRSAFMILSAVPIWMNEVVPPKNRGSFVDLHGAALLFGYAVSAWVGLAFYHLNLPHNSAWRGPMGMSPCRSVYTANILTLKNSNSVSACLVGHNHGFCSARKPAVVAHE